MKNRILVVFLFSSFWSGAQNLNTSKLDSLFDMLSQHNLAMGSVVISIDNKVRYQKSIGKAFISEEKNVAATSDTRYRIGSVSKLFTATMIFQLVEEKKLTLDRTLDAFFPTLPNAAKITISDLLYHRSGLHNYTTDTDYPDWMDQPRTHEQLLSLITQKGADFAPRAKMEYCNSNYLVLSYILEKIDKDAYETSLRKRITDRIKLANTYYGKPIDPARGESASYRFSDNSWVAVKETDMSIHSGAGSIVSTPQDMVRFIEALFAYKLISKPSVDKMTTLVSGYGMGIFPYESGMKKGFGHDGKIEEFASSLQYFPKEKLAVAFCANGQVYAKDNIMDDILSICFNQPFEIPYSKTISLTGEALDRYVGKYSSENPPITMICSCDGNVLQVETKGQVFILEPYKKGQFRNIRYGFFFEFKPEKRELIIRESDKAYYLKRAGD